jgi:hypothetical protein
VVQKRPQATSVFAGPVLHAVIEKITSVFAGSALRDVVDKSALCTEFFTQQVSCDVISSAVRTPQRRRYRAATFRGFRFTVPSTERDHVRDP